MIEVTVVLLDDGLASTAVTPVEVFSTAGVLWNALLGRPPEPRFQVRTASLDGGPVLTPSGVCLTAQAALRDIDRTDVVVLSASGVDFEEKLARNQQLIAWLKAQYQAGAHVAAVCSGVLYLAEAGLLDGRAATSHWALCDDMRKRYPRVDWRPDHFVTEDSRVLCSGGVYGAADLSLYLVEKFAGREVALRCAKALLLPMPRTHQGSYATLPVSRPHDDAVIRRAERHLEAHMQEDIATPALAELAGLGVRTFIRRFKAATGRPPADYLQALRIAAAKSMLESGGLPIQSISLQVGYRDAAFFRALFKRQTGMTPADYRTRFGPLTVAGAGMN